MSYHRLRFDSEPEAHAALVAAGIEREDGTFDARSVSVVHLGALRPDGCPGCLNTPSPEAPAYCAVAAGTGPCPAACWHVDVWGPSISDEPLTGEVSVTTPKHNAL